MSSDEPDSPPALQEYDNKPHNVSSSKTSSSHSSTSSSSNTTTTTTSDDDVSDAKKGKGSSYYFFKSTPADEAAKYRPTLLSTTSNSNSSASNSNSISISTSTSTSTSTSASNSTTGLSAWNAAGTWEERDTSDWCHDHVRKLLSGATKTSSGVTVTIKRVTKVEGECSIVFARGKKRPGYDLHISCEWEADDPSSDADEPGQGTIDIPEFETSMDVDDVVIKFSKKTASDAMLKAAKAAEPLLRAKLTQFIKDFQAQC